MYYFKTGNKTSRDTFNLVHVVVLTLMSLLTMHCVLLVVLFM